MNPITSEEIQALIPEWGLVDLDRMFNDLTNDKDDDQFNIHYCAHGDDLAEWLEQGDEIAKDEIIAAPFLGDLLICHFELEGASMSVLHRRLGDEILSFPFVNDGSGWVPAPMMTYLSRKKYMSRSFLPPRLSDSYNARIGDWSPDTAKAVVGRIIAASLMLALKDEGETIQ